MQRLFQVVEYFRNGYSTLARNPYVETAFSIHNLDGERLNEIGRRVAKSPRLHDHHNRDDRTPTRPSQLSSEHVDDPLLSD